MAILGNNTKGADNSGLGDGRMYVTSFVLATAQVMTELHGWFGSTVSAGATVRIVIYADSAGSPGARIAYTNILTLSIVGDEEKSQTGFNVNLPAGTYWLGFFCITQPGGARMYADTAGGTHKGNTGGLADPPPDPFGTINTSGTRVHSVWAVVNPPASGGGGMRRTRARLRV